MHGRRRLSPSGQQNAVPKDRTNVSGIVLLRRTRHPHRYFRLLDPRKPWSALFAFCASGSDKTDQFRIFWYFKFLYQVLSRFSCLSSGGIKNKYAKEKHFRAVSYWGICMARKCFFHDRAKRRLPTKAASRYGSFDSKPISCWSVCPRCSSCTVFWFLLRLSLTDALQLFFS